MNFVSLVHPADLLSSIARVSISRDRGFRVAALVSLLIHGVCLGWLPGLKDRVAEAPQKLQVKLSMPVADVEPVAVPPTRAVPQSANAFRREAHLQRHEGFDAPPDTNQQVQPETPMLRAAEPIAAKTAEIPGHNNIPRVLPSKQLDANLLTVYGRELAGAIATHRRYPRIALMRQWQGDVVLQLEFGVHGGLITARVLSSSGHDVLDRQALEMVQNAVPLPQLPADLVGRFFIVDVPVVFRLAS